MALSAEEISARAGALAEVLLDAVAGGASVNFMADFSRAAAEEYFRGVAAQVAAGRRILFAAEVNAVHMPVGEVNAVHMPVGEVNAVHMPVGEVNAVHVPVGEVNAVHVPVGEVNSVHPAALEGTAQLVLDTPPNQPHRAELAKMLVHRRARRHDQRLLQSAALERGADPRQKLRADLLGGRRRAA